MLVKTIPEISKRDGGVYTCSIGYSDELGFIRVYPMPLTGMQRWGTYEIEVEKNNRDSRHESWKLSSYTRHENFVGFEKDMLFIGMSNKIDLIKKMMLQTSPSLSRLNENRLSIGFIQTSLLNAYWHENDKYVNTKQIGMFDDVELADFTKYTKATKERESRINFIDGDGKHDLQLNDWQYYEYQRKFGAKPDAFRFMNDSKPKLLLVGNMFQYRSKWIALGVFTPKYNSILQNSNTLF